MWDKELMGEFRSLLANGNWHACEKMLGHADPSPAQAQLLLNAATHCKKRLPRSGASVEHQKASTLILRLKAICEPKRNLPNKAKKAPSKKEQLAEQADLVIREVQQKEGRRKGRGTVAKGWMQEPQKGGV